MAHPTALRGPRNREKISAEEVENLILGHPAVLNVACVPVPDPVLGERMCACVLLRPDELGFSEEVMHKVFHANAERVLGLKQP